MFGVFRLAALSLITVFPSSDIPLARKSRCSLSLEYVLLLHAHAPHSSISNGSITHVPKHLDASIVDKATQNSFAS